MSVKMSDVFMLPVNEEMIKNGDLCMREVDMAGEAINAYDSNQELIASQAEELEQVYAKLEKEFNSGEDARCKLDDAKDQIEALEVAAKAAIIMISEISGMDISDVALDVNNRAMGLIEATKLQGEEG